MRVTYESLVAPVSEDMRAFGDYFDSLLTVPGAGLRVILRYALGRRGKMLRPLLVYLSAGALGRINETTRAAAAMVELIHNASLLHDDVIDQADLRRGQPAVYRLWRSKGAVLAGDYMFALGLKLAVETGQYGLLALMNTTVQQMSESELEQLRRARGQQADPEGYFEVIRGKTAALLRTATACGARSVRATSEQEEGMRAYGENLGIAFQIQDDILDFTGSGAVGKRTGNDLREGKRTLPIIYALESVSGASARSARTLLVRAQTDDSALREALAFVRGTDALSRASETAREFTVRAAVALSCVPESACKASLVGLGEFLLGRDK